MYATPSDRTAGVGTGMDTAARDAQRAFWFAWNTADAQALAEAWPAYRAALRSIGGNAGTWASELSAHPDLAGGLVRFCESRL